MKIYRLFQKDNLKKAIRTYKRKPTKGDLSFHILEKDYHLYILIDNLQVLELHLDPNADHFVYIG